MCQQTNSNNTNRSTCFAASEGFPLHLNGSTLGAIAQSLRADFHAKTSQPQEREPDSKASAADSGGKRLPPLAWFDPKSSAWKTFQRCLLEGWTLFSDRWPRSGIVCNGIAYLLPTLARRTDMIESGLSESGKIWPTPRASEWKGTGPLGSKSHKYRLGKKYLDATVQEANQKTGALNADWVSILMGYSLDWTIVEDGNAESHGSPRGKKTGPKD